MGFLNDIHQTQKNTAAILVELKVIRANFDKLLALLEQPDDVRLADEATKLQASTNAVQKALDQVS